MSLNQNLPARLLAVATILASLTFTAHADTYRFYVNNFDGYGSSLTFELPSSVPSVRIDGIDNQVIQDPVVDFIFQPGSSIPTYFPGVNFHTIVQNTTYEQFGAPESVGFDDHGPDFLVGLLLHGNLDILGADLAQERNLSTPLFTEEDGVTEHTGIATFKLGTFGNVEIVNATPEPSTLCLFGTGIVGLVGVARRKLSS
jgi:hypothetical protein